MPEQALWPLALYIGVVLVLVALVLAASALLGERHRAAATGDPFESGIVPVQPARLRLNAKFYLVAMLFVIFDLEAVYIVAWAVIARQAGWAAYIEISIFIAVLLAGLAYLWKLGALDWGTRPQAGGRRASALPPFAVEPRAPAHSQPAGAAQAAAARGGPT